MTSQKDINLTNPFCIWRKNCVNGMCVMFCLYFSSLSGYLQYYQATLITAIDNVPALAIVYNLGGFL